MEQDLRFLSAAVHLAPIVLFSFDANGVITVSDGRGLEALGFSPGELVGRSVFDVYAHEPDVIENCRRALSGEEFTTVTEIKSLGLFWETRFVPVRDTAGKVTGTVGVTANVTETVRSNARLQALAARLRSVQEEERRRISREVHDELGQACAALKIDLSFVKERLAGADGARDAAVDERVSRMLSLIDSTSHRIRDFAQELRPTELDDIGLDAALRWHVSRFQERTGIRCTVDLSGWRSGASKESETAIYRIAQEAMTNIARHAGARQVGIELSREDGKIVLVCEDDGRGIADGREKDPGALGIIGMRERASALGGSLEISPRPGGGTRVRARA